MKYITSCSDIVLVFLLLFLYTRSKFPPSPSRITCTSIVFPLIALTAFRYDRKLTLGSPAAWQLVLYLLLVLYLSFSEMVALTKAGYERELFTSGVTYIGQGTKFLILSYLSF